MEVELKEDNGLITAFFAVIATALVCAGLGVAFISRWKDEAYSLRHAIEVHELSVATQKREALAARKEAEAAKSETAMCRKAVGHADKAVANMDAALKWERRAREKGE